MKTMMNVKWLLFIFYGVLFPFSQCLSQVHDPILIKSVTTAGYGDGVVIQGNYLYMVEGEMGFQIFDISNPANPVPAGYVDTPGTAFGISVAGNYAYIADSGAGLQIIDVSIPTNPTIVGNYTTDGIALRVKVSGNHAFIADHSGGLKIIDVSNPSSPNLVGNFSCTAWDLEIQGNLVYIVDGYDGLKIVNVAEPSNPTLEGYLDLQNGAYSIAVNGNYAYMQDGDYNLVVIDISNPANPQALGNYQLNSVAWNLLSRGNLVFVPCGYAGFVIINCINPSSPVLWGYADVSGYLIDVAVHNNYAYVNQETTTGLLVFNLPNNPPTLSSISVITGAIEDTPFIINYNTLINVADEQDSDNDILAFRIESVISGVLTRNGVPVTPRITLLLPGEQLIWTPPQNQNGLIDAFTVVAWDGQDASASPVVVKINTLAVNDPPVANGQNVTTPEDASVNITLTGSDIDGDQLTFTVVTQPTNGTLSGTAPNLIYTPNANYNGTDAFTFKVNDGAVDSSVAIINITITALNDPPVATGQSVVTFEDTPVNIQLVASDVDGDVLTYTIVNQPLHGTLSGTFPNLIYTPSGNYFGSDNFTFKVNDGTVESGVATVNITVLSVNDPPGFNIKHSSIVVNEDSPQTNITGFAYNIHKGADNERSQPLMFKVVVDNPALFSTVPTIRLNGTLSFKPAPNANGRATVTAYLIDGGGTANGGNDTSLPRIFTIDIVNVNDPPVLKPLDRFFINRTEYEDTYQEGGYKYNFGVTDLETMPQHLTLTVTSTNQSLVPDANIRVAANGTNRVVTVTPVANASGTTLLTFTLSDGTNVVTKTSVLRVMPVNDAPYFELLNDSLRCLANAGRFTSEIINMSTLSVGPQNESSQSWTFQVISNTEPGAFSTLPIINKYGVLTFTPKKGFVGNVTLGIVMVDSGGIANGGQNSYGPVELNIQIFDYSFPAPGR